METQNKHFQELEIGDCIGIISHEDIGVQLVIATIEDVFLCSKMPDKNRLILSCQDFLDVDLHGHDRVITMHSVYYADPTEAVDAYKKHTQDIAEKALKRIAIIKSETTNQQNTSNQQ